MKIIPNVHDYFMEQTFNIRGTLAKDGRFDNNNYGSNTKISVVFASYWKEEDAFRILIKKWSKKWKH